MKLLKFRNYLLDDTPDSLVVEGTESTVPRIGPCRAAKECARHVHGLHHVGLPPSSFRDSEVEQKNRLFVLHKEEANMWKKFDKQTNTTQESDSKMC